MLKDKIDALIESAMKTKDEKRLSTLRMIKAGIVVLEKSGLEYNKASELKMLTKMKSTIEDSIEQFTIGGRPDLADKERLDLEIVKEFLPKEASSEKIEEAVNKAIDSLDHAPSMKDMKTIIDEVHKVYPAVNGKIVSEILRKRM